jgi:uncharacterized small protein (DUF1192 family)
MSDEIERMLLLCEEDRKEMAAEINRLKADNRSHETTLANYADKVKWLQEEIERLKEKK